MNWRYPHIVAEKLQVTKRTVYRWRAGGGVDLPHEFNRQDYLRPAEIMEILAISRSSVYRYCQEGLWESIKIGPKILLISKRSFELWLEQTLAETARDIHEHQKDR